MNYADVINSRLTTREVAVRYGLEPNRKGFVCCPFHNEKTASMKIYPDSRGFYCFGCGAGGDTINFVEKLFDIERSQAVQRLDYDFSLGLSIRKKLSYRERQAIIAENQARRAEMRRAQEEEEELYQKWQNLLFRFTELEKNKRLYAPKTDSEELHPLFVEALLNLERVGFELDEADAERRKCERTDYSRI